MEIILTGLTIEQAEAVINALKKIGYEPPKPKIQVQSIDGEEPKTKPRQGEG